jgi:SAM-dependent methyltransferase
MSKKSIDYTHIANIYDAYVYDTFDVDFFLNECRKTDGNVLELMSGTGRVSIPLLESGIPLTCVDLSKEMLEVFRKRLKVKGLSAPVYQMDVCKLNLQQKFDLIFIPFHAFAEIIDKHSQLQTLQAIKDHLNENGRFICTLHNPALRLKSIDGKLHLWRSSPLAQNQGTLMLWGLVNYDPDTHIVSGYQFYEIYDSTGLMQSKQFVEINFYMHQKNEFEEMLKSAGFKVQALYGDYSYGEFREDESLFMIWEVVK